MGLSCRVCILESGCYSESVVKFSSWNISGNSFCVLCYQSRQQSISAGISWSSPVEAIWLVWAKNLAQHGLFSKLWQDRASSERPSVSYTLHFNFPCHQFSCGIITILHGAEKAKRKFWSESSWKVEQVMLLIFWDTTIRTCVFKYFFLNFKTWC